MSRYSYLQTERPNNFNLLTYSHLIHTYHISPIVHQDQINKFETCDVTHFKPVRKRTKAKLLRKNDVFPARHLCYVHIFTDYWNRIFA